MARQLTELAAVLSSIVELDEAMSNAMGAAGKKAALDTVALSRHLGADRRFSGLRGGRGPQLAAGYDIEPSRVVVNLRPEGLWILAESGRRRSGQIAPSKKRRTNRARKPRGRPAVGSGGRFVAVGRFRPSRGLHTITDALAAMDTAVPAAVGAAIDTKLRRM